MKRFVVRRIVTVLCTTGLFALSSQVMASGFQLFEQDGASEGNYHAGYAAEANDASTGFYNPAGLTRIKNQQLVVGNVGIMTDFKYRGSVTLTEAPLPPANFTDVTAQGGAFSMVPDLHYAAPLYERVVFGLSVTAPFGLKTNYGRSSVLRYAATKTSIMDIDISPELGVKVTDQASVGVGFDIQRAFAEFDSVAGLITFAPPFALDPSADSTSINKANDTAYGYHLGVLYEFTPTMRLGVSYHSQVTHHFSGSSTFAGPIPSELFDVNQLRSNEAKTKVTLPAYTAISMFDRVTPCVALMGSVIYTQWSSFNLLQLNGVAGLSPTLEPTTDLTITIPEHYQNTWNASLGANYYPTETITIRSGIGYDQTPVQDRYRNVQLPDNDRYTVALGGHFQATKTIGLDVGWTHLFIKNVLINPPGAVVGPAVVETNGHANGGADVFSGQVVWDIV